MKISETKSFVQLLKEGIDQELLDWGLKYIEENSCDSLYKDMLDYQELVNKGEVILEPQDKVELDKNIKKFNIGRTLACKMSKEEIKKSFKKGSEEQPEKLKTNLCWFANKKGKTLKACVTSTGGTPTVTQPTGPTGGGQQGGTPSGQSGTSGKSGPQPTTQSVTKKFDYDNWEF